MNPYKPWDFCKDTDCKSYRYPGLEEERILFFCEKCKAFRMHGYLREHGQIIEEGITNLETVDLSMSEWPKVDKLLDLLEPLITVKEQLILHDAPVLVETIAAFRALRPR